MKLKKRTLVFTLLLLALLVTALFPAPETAPIRYIERHSGELKTEKVAGEKWLVWLYNNPIGELGLQALVKRKVVSEWYGRRMDAPGSARKIAPFAEDFNIDLSIALKQEFSSFNDFFTRKLKAGARPVNMDSNVIISPADGKVLAYADVSENDFMIKGKRFNVYRFLADSGLAKNYEQGSLLVFRLCPADYHRFHFPIAGILSPVTPVSGDYYSVNPIALREMIEIFCENKREYLLINNPQLGNVVMAEVGATMVGSIVQTYQGNHAIKGEEKGYFRFGGSTVVLLFEKNKLKIDDDLLLNTSNNLETTVLMGEQIGMGI